MELKSILTIFLFSIATTLTQGQYIPIVEEDKFWIYLRNDDIDHPSPLSGHAITLQGDTIINSVSYKKVYSYSLNGWHNCPHGPCFQLDRPYQSHAKFLIAFIREDTINRKVYNLPDNPYEGFCDTSEHLIFDYSLGIGDTMNACIYNFIGADPEYPFEPLGIVDSIGVVPRFGKNRNTIFSTGIARHGGLPFYSEVLLLEGIGLEHYGILHEPLTYLVDFCEGGMEACELILSNAPVEKEYGVNIFPNPTQGQFTLTINDELLNTTCTIIKSLDQAMQSFELTELNTLAQLNVPGIYFWRVEQDGRLMKTGKLICH